MKTITLVPVLALLVAAWGPSSCGGNTPTPAPVPPPAPPVVVFSDAGPPPAPPKPAPTPEPTPQPPTDSCAAECATLGRLHCPEWSPTCDADCARLDATLAKLKSAPQNHACIATAASCPAAKKCRP
jgi:hypothetical protein